MTEIAFVRAYLVTILKTLYYKYWPGHFNLFYMIWMGWENKNIQYIVVNYEFPDALLAIGFPDKG